MNSYYVEILVNLFALLVKVDEKEKQRKIRQNEESERQTTYQTKIRKNQTRCISNFRKTKTDKQTHKLSDKQRTKRNVGKSGRM